MLGDNGKIGTCMTFQIQLIIVVVLYYTFNYYIVLYYTFHYYTFQ